MSEHSPKAGKTFRLILNALLVPQYVYLIILIVSSMPFVPWYDPAGNVLMHFFILWVPLCVTTLVLAATTIISRVLYRPRFILLCFNALIIPLCYLLEIAGVTPLLYAVKIIGAASVIAYSIMTIVSIKKGTV